MARIGIESEFPIVDQHGEAAGREAMGAVFRGLIERYDFEPYYDGDTGALIGVSRSQGAGRLDVGTDVGICTLEVAFPPEEDFSTAEVAWNAVLDDVIVPELALQQLSILGYGCQPKTETAGSAFMADKGHYELVSEIMAQRPSHYAADALPSFAALQFNLDVPKSQVVLATNTFVKLSPLICAWSANSPVYAGRVLPWLELRVKGYLLLAEINPIFTDRLYFPRRLYDSLADYMHEAWALPLFEVTRGGRIFHPVQESLTTLDFATAGQGEFVDLGGRGAVLDCTAADLATGLVFSWPSIRVKCRLDEGRGVSAILDAVAAGEAESVLLGGGQSTFIEVRHLPTMSRTESFAWLAMFLGWLGDIEACAALVDGWDLDEVKTCFDEVLLHGWGVRIGGRRLCEWGADAFDIAHRALAAEPQPLQERIQLLRRRLDARSSPATDALDTFNAHGVGALVDELKLG